MARTVYLVDLVAYDPGVPGTVTLRYGTEGFTSGPGDTPANTHWDGRVDQPAVMRRDLFDVNTTGGASRVGYGDLILKNGDGQLDALKDYGVDGRAITIWRGPKTGTYPTDFTKFLVATMAAVEVGRDTVTIKLRDRQAEIHVPLQTTKYAGDNSLPDGLEGVATDLKGKPKPVCLGTVLNVPAVCVNTSKLIYQVHDGAIASLDAVYDRGIPLIAGFPFSMETSGFGSNNVNCSAYGAGVHVIAGAAGNLASSSDGVTYTARTSTFGTSPINGLVWSDELGLFVAVGDGGKIATSSDGVNWTAQTSGVGVSLKGVAVGDGTLVAVGTSGTIISSTDATSWTSRTSGVSVGLAGVGFGRGLFVVCGGYGFPETSTILTSPDGTTWTSRTSPFGTNDALKGVAYGLGRFVIVGTSTGVTAGVASSPDGKAWIVRVDTSAASYNAVAFAERAGVFVAVGTTNSLAVSPDGDFWLPFESGFTATNLLTVHAGADAIVVGGSSGALGLSVPSTGTYSSLADLQDESLAPVPGTFKTYLAGGYFRLGSIPTGQITADVTQGAAASDRTAGQLFTDVLERAGLSSGDWTAADITALDSANNAVCGYWTAEEGFCDEVLTLLAASVGAWWGVDQAGKFRIQQFTAPSGSPVHSFVADDMVRPLERLTPNDASRGIPTYQSVVRWGRVYAVQTDLALGVTPDHKALVSRAYREAVSTDTAVQTVHLLAPQVIEDSLLTTESDAQDEADRRQTLRGDPWDLYTFTTALDDATAALDLWNVLGVTHARYGLNGGGLFRILGVEPDAAQGRVAFTIWGSA